MGELVRGLSSMATRRLLADLSDVNRRPPRFHFESAGGTDVAAKVRARVDADIVVLSDEVMGDLDAEGLFEVETLRPLFVSDVVAATPIDVASRPLSTEDDLLAALVAADQIAYSTGPSGDGLIELLARWEIVEIVEPKLLQVRPGTPVGTVLADGAADLGFQQRSEMSEIPGVRVLGPLPGSASIRSTFSGAVLAWSKNKGSAREVLRFLTSESAEVHVVAAGMALA